MTASTSDLINCGESDDGIEEQPTIIGKIKIDFSLIKLSHVVF